MKNYSEVQIISTPSVKIGDEKLDNLFSNEGGIEWANLIFLTGTSGAGKTTLCKKLQSLISEHVSVFYSREMLSSLVKKQTLRLDIKHNNAFISDVKDFPHFDDFMKMVEGRSDIKILILDSIQRIAEDYTKQGMSLEAAMRHIYSILMSWKDRTNGIVIIIGQVTKDGDFQGANFLKHDADAHVHMVYDKKKNTRTIETTKNRMGKLDKLYYEILDSSETLKFYSVEEFENKKENITFAEIIRGSIATYLKGINKNHKNYLTFKKELSKKIEYLYENSSNFSTEFEVILEYTKIIKELSDKYEINELSKEDNTKKSTEEVSQ